MTTDPVRAGWIAGQAAYAAWLTLESPAAAGVAARAGFDPSSWNLLGEAAVSALRASRDPPPRRVGSRP